MWFTLLGQVRVLREEREVRLGAPQQRAFLALLLAAGGQPVGVEDLVDGLWGQDPPPTALNVLHRNVGMLRRTLEPGLAAREAGRWLLPAAGGYRLAVDAASADLLQFRQQVARAWTAAAEDRPAEAVDCYVRALRLWRGSAGAGIPPAVRARPVFATLDREYAATVGEAAKYALAAGLPAPLLPAVRAAAERESLDELLQARLIQLLAATGRQNEALDLYREVRAQLTEDLGIDPGPELTAAGESVLRRPSARPATRAGVTRPAQLPADPPVFAGRSAELARLPAPEKGPSEERPSEEDHDGAGPGATGIRVICGMGGIGKTTLAVHWAHQVAHHYPDGQLFLNLRGFHPSEQAMSAGEALNALLAGLGVAAEEVPVTVEERAALFRGRVAGRRLLLLLDNARDAQQVRPLLPASAGCLAIVTSRNRLDGLVVNEDAHPLALEPLPDGEAADLLRARLGAARVEAEPDATAQILSLCGGLPLALVAVAAYALTHPSFTLASIAAELRRARGNLDGFTGFDATAAPQAVFSWSYRAHPGGGPAVPAAGHRAGARHQRVGRSRPGRRAAFARAPPAAGAHRRPPAHRARAGPLHLPRPVTRVRRRDGRRGGDRSGPHGRPAPASRPLPPYGPPLLGADQTRPERDPLPRAAGRRRPGPDRRHDPGAGLVRHRGERRPRHRRARRPARARPSCRASGLVGAHLPDPDVPRGARAGIGADRGGGHGAARRPAHARPRPARPGVGVHARRTARRGARHLPALLAAVHRAGGREGTVRHASRTDPPARPAGPSPGGAAARAALSRAVPSGRSDPVRGGRRAERGGLGADPAGPAPRGPGVQPAVAEPADQRGRPELRPLHHRLGASPPG